MKGFFRYDGPFFGTMSRIFDLVVLNWLWLLLSLPIVTIGASTTALYTVTLRMARDEDTHNIRSFFQAFAANFKRSTLLWVLYALVGGWLLAGVYAMSHGTAPILKGLAIVEAGVFLILLLGLLYLFPLQARFTNSLRGTVAAAQTLALRHLPASLLMIAIVAVQLLLAAYVAPLRGWLVLLWVMLGAAGTAFLCSGVLESVFRKELGQKENAPVPAGRS